MDKIDKAFNDWAEDLDITEVVELVRQAWLAGAHWGIDVAKEIIEEECQRRTEGTESGS